MNVRGRFNTQSLKEFEEAITEKGFLGLKLLPNYTRDYPNDPRAYPFYQKAAELEVPVLLHMGSTTASFALYDAGRPVYLDDIAEDFPDVKFCAAHLAYPWEKELFGLMKKCPNIYADISGSIALRPTVLTWDLVLAKEYKVLDRIMFGSDYRGTIYSPFGSRKEFIEWLRTGLNKQADKSGWPTFTKGEIDNILGKTAKAYLGL